MAVCMQSIRPQKVARPSPWPYTKREDPGDEIALALGRRVNMAANVGASNQRSASADVTTQRREKKQLMKKKLVKGDTW